MEHVVGHINIFNSRKMFFIFIVDFSALMFMIVRTEFEFLVSFVISFILRLRESITFGIRGQTKTGDANKCFRPPSVQR